jgi:hypothetical protein
MGQDQVIDHLPALKQDLEALLHMHGGELPMGPLQEPPNGLRIDPKFRELPDIIEEGEHGPLRLDLQFGLGRFPGDSGDLDRGGDELRGAQRDGYRTIDLDPMGGDAVGMQELVVGASAELLDADRTDLGATGVPRTQPDLSPGEEAFGWVRLLRSLLHGNNRCDLEVREEPQEGLGTDHIVEPLHPEVLERGEGIDDDPTVQALHRLHLERLHERGDGDLHATELIGLAWGRFHIPEPLGAPHGCDVLERGLLVPHHIRDRIEDPDLVDVLREGPEIGPQLVGGFVQGDIQDFLSLTDPLEEELHGYRGLSRPGRADQKIGPGGEETPSQHLVQPLDPRGDPHMGAHEPVSHGTDTIPM